MARSNQYLKWNEISGDGLTSAVNSAAVATAGLAEANRDIVGLADKFTKLGQDISKTATERRDKALNEYSNNLFNEALQGSMNADGTVNSGLLMHNLKTLRERDKANGEFWNDQEVGNKLGALTLKYNDTFADNYENRRKNKADEAARNRELNLANTRDTAKLVQDINTEYNNYLTKYAEFQNEAAKYNITLDDKGLLDELSGLMQVVSDNMYYTDANGNTHYRSADDSNTANALMKAMKLRQAKVNEIAKMFTDWQAKIAEAKAKDVGDKTNVLNKQP